MLAAAPFSVGEAQNSNVTPMSGYPQSPKNPLVRRSMGAGLPWKFASADSGPLFKKPFTTEPIGRNVNKVTDILERE